MMTFDDYEKQKQERLAKLTTDTENDLQERFFTYGKEKMGYSPDIARDFAESVLKPGEINSNDDDDDDGDDNLESKFGDTWEVTIPLVQH